MWGSSSGDFQAPQDDFGRGSAGRGIIMPDSSWGIGRGRGRGAVGPSGINSNFGAGGGPGGAMSALIELRRYTECFDQLRIIFNQEQMSEGIDHTDDLGDLDEIVEDLRELGGATPNDDRRYREHLNKAYRWERQHSQIKQYFRHETVPAPSAPTPTSMQNDFNYVPPTPPTDVRMPMPHGGGSSSNLLSPNIPPYMHQQQQHYLPPTRQAPFPNPDFNPQYPAPPPFVYGSVPQPQQHRGPPPDSYKQPINNYAQNLQYQQPYQQQSFPNQRPPPQQWTRQRQPGFSGPYGPPHWGNNSYANPVGPSSFPPSNFQYQAKRNYHGAYKGPSITFYSSESASYQPRQEWLRRRQPIPPHMRQPIPPHLPQPTLAQQRQTTPPQHSPRMSPRSSPDVESPPRMLDPSPPRQTQMSPPFHRPPENTQGQAIPVQLTNNQIPRPGPSLNRSVSFGDTVPPPRPNTTSQQKQSGSRNKRSLPESMSEEEKLDEIRRKTKSTVFGGRGRGPIPMRGTGRGYVGGPVPNSRGLQGMIPLTRAAPSTSNKSFKLNQPRPYNRSQSEGNLDERSEAESGSTGGVNAGGTSTNSVRVGAAVASDPAIPNKDQLLQRVIAKVSQPKAKKAVPIRQRLSDQYDMAPFGGAKKKSTSGGITSPKENEESPSTPAGESVQDQSGSNGNDELNSIAKNPETNSSVSPEKAKTVLSPAHKSKGRAEKGRSPPLDEVFQNHEQEKQAERRVSNVIPRKGVIRNREGSDEEAEVTDKRKRRKSERQSRSKGAASMSSSASSSTTTSSSLSKTSSSNSSRSKSNSTTSAQKRRRIPSEAASNEQSGFGETGKATGRTRNKSLPSTPHFSPTNIQGPRDVVCNTSLGKIKMESDYRSPTGVKREKKAEGQESAVAPPGKKRRSEVTEKSGQVVPTDKSLEVPPASRPEISSPIDSGVEKEGLTVRTKTVIVYEEDDMMQQILEGMKEIEGDPEPNPKSEEKKIDVENSSIEYSDEVQMPLPPSIQIQNADIFPPEHLEGVSTSQTTPQSEEVPAISLQSGEVVEIADKRSAISLEMAEIPLQSEEVAESSEGRSEIPQEEKETEIPLQSDEIPPGSDAIPTEADEIRREPDEIPAESHEIPPEYDEISPQSEEIPPEADEIPPEADEIPRESDEIPLESDEIPTEYEEISPQSEEIPQEADEVPPESDEILPESHKIIPPEYDEIPPQSEEIPQEADEIPPESDEIPPESHEIIPPEYEEIPPQSEEIPQEADAISPQSEEIPQEADEVPPESDEIPPGSHEIPPEYDEISPQLDEIPQEADEIPPQSEAAPPLTSPSSGEMDEAGPAPVLSEEEITPSPGSTEKHRGEHEMGIEGQVSPYDEDVSTRALPPNEDEEASGTEDNGCSTDEYESHGGVICVDWRNTQNQSLILASRVKLNGKMNYESDSSSDSGTSTTECPTSEEDGASHTCVVNPILTSEGTRELPTLVFLGPTLHDQNTQAQTVDVASSRINASISSSSSSESSDDFSDSSGSSVSGRDSFPRSLSSVVSSNAGHRDLHNNANESPGSGELPEKGKARVTEWLEKISTSVGEEELWAPVWATSTTDSTGPYGPDYDFEFRRLRFKFVTSKTCVGKTSGKEKDIERDVNSD